MLLEKLNDCLKVTHLLSDKAGLRLKSVLIAMSALNSYAIHLNTYRNTTVPHNI